MKDNKSGKKRGLALLISLLAVFIFAGSLLAFFSDKITGSANVTAGTLDIEGDYKLYYNGNSTAETSNVITNFNPGDFVVVEAVITNTGSKSAWIRNLLTINGDLISATLPNSTESVITIYEGEVKDFSLQTNKKVTLTNNKFASAAEIIDGTVEEDNTTPSDLVTGNTYKPTYTIYFEPAAGNNAQNKNISLVLETQAIQYRNNITTPNNQAWDNVETYTLP